MHIKKITLQSGFLNTIDDRSKCATLSFEGETIPQDVIETLTKEDYKTLKPRYGDHSWGEPIQYDLLEIEDEEGIKTIEVFNRAILLLLHNVEETQRLHRIVYSVEKYIKKNF